MTSPAKLFKLKLVRSEAAPGGGAPPDRGQMCGLLDTTLYCNDLKGKASVQQLGGLTPGSEKYFTINGFGRAGPYTAEDLAKLKLHGVDNVETELRQSKGLAFKGNVHLNAPTTVLHGRNGLQMVRQNQQVLAQIGVDLGAPGFEDVSIHFGRITAPSGDFLDLVLIDRTGLYLYSKPNQQDVYGLVHYCPRFAQAAGWIADYSKTMKFRDVNDDQRDELIFTGPNGIEILSFNTASKIWESLLCTEDLPVIDRHRRVINGNGDPSIPLTIMTTDSAGIMNQIWQLVPTDPPKLAEPPTPKQIRARINAKTAAEQYKKITVYYPHWRTPVPLKDSMDYKIFQGTVDIFSGSSRFTIPLMNLFYKPLGFLALAYDANNLQSGSLGVGWNFPEYSIIADSQHSVHQEDFKYYLFAPSVVEEIVRDENNFYEFRLKSGGDLVVKYNRYAEKWSFTQNGVEFEFGRGSNPGPVFHRGTKETRTQPFVWHLSKMPTYDIEFIYNAENHVQTIMYSDGSIAIAYDKKTAIELSNVGPHKLDTVGTQFIKDITINTKNFYQLVQFDYMILGKERFLTAIKDQGNDVAVRFEYVEWPKTGAMTRIIAGDQFNVQFDLQKIFDTTERSVNLAPGIQTRFYHGTQFHIIAWMKNDALWLEVLDADMTDIIDRRSINDAKNSKVILSSNMYIVVLNDVQHNVYYRKGSGFANQPGWAYKSNLLRFGNDFVAFIDKTNSLKIWEYNRESQSIVEHSYGSICPNPDKGIMAADKERFVLFCHPELRNYHKIRGEWKLTVTTEAVDAHSKNEAFLKLFQTTSEKYAFTWNILQGNSLQIQNNFIIINTLQLNNHKLTQNVRIYSVNGKMQERHNFEIPRDEMSKITWVKKKEEVEQCVFDYEILSSPNSQGFIYMVRRKSGKSSECPVEASYLIDVKDYMIRLDNSVILTGGRTMKFNDNGWNLLPEEKPVVPKRSGCDPPPKEEPPTRHISSKFRLEQQNSESVVKLIKSVQDTSVVTLTLPITDMLSLINGYPNYLSYNYNNKVWVIEFSNYGEDAAAPVAREGNMVLHANSNPDLLITIKKEGDSEKLVFFLQNTNPTVIKRQVINYRNNDPTISSLVATNAERPGTKHRATRYEYNVQSSLYYYDDVKIIPGSDERVFGSIHMIRSAKEIITKTYNEARRLLQTKKTQPPEQPDNDDMFKETTIYGPNGRVEIAQFYPYKLTDDEAGYHDFEWYLFPYIHPGSTPWTKPEKFEYKSDNLLTGSRYLSIAAGTQFEGVFTPKNQEATYKASTWVLPNEDLAIGSLSTHLRTDIKYKSGNTVVTSVLSTVKAKRGDWYLLEAIVNLPVLKEVAEPKQEEPLKINIIVAPKLDEKLGMDHILFTPLISSAEARVYDEKTWQVTDKITHNDLVTKYIYDPYRNLVSIVNEYNQIHEMNSYTKADNLIQYVTSKEHQPCKIKIQSSNGRLETFDRNSLQHRWELSKSGLQYDRIQTGYNILRYNGIPDAHMKLTGLTSSSFCVRFLFMMNGSIGIQGTTVRLKAESKQSDTISQMYEMILIVENSEYYVFVNGALVEEGTSTEPQLLRHPTFKLHGNVYLKDVITMERPQVMITYVNSLNEAVQSIQLVDDNTVIRQTFINDEIGRKLEETLPEIVKGTDATLRYRPAAITQFTKSKIFKYQKDPTENVQSIELKSANINIRPEALPRYSNYLEDDILGPFSDMYPIVDGYTHRVELNQGPIKTVNIYNTQSQMVARYEYKVGSKGHYSMYDYNTNNQLHRTIPPLFFEAFFATTAKSAEEKAIMAAYTKYSTTVRYTRSGKLWTVTSPDAGKVEHLYNSEGQLKFIVTMAYDSKDIRDITYYNYDEFGRLESVGSFTEMNTMDGLAAKADADVAVNAQVTPYQVFETNDSEQDPYLRQNVKRVTTKYGQTAITEELLSNLHNKVYSKRVYLRKTDSDMLTIEINKKYSSERLVRIEYPYERQGADFQVVYSYNRLGQISAVGRPGEPEYFASYEHNPQGAITKENFKRNSRFTRSYGYNALGYPVSLSDTYLIEKLYYHDPENQRSGFGDATIYWTHFTPSWVHTAGIAAGFTNEPTGFKYKYNDFTELIAAKYYQGSDYDTPREFDVDFFDIDPNGNLKIFYRGHTRYQLDYIPNTNRIKSIEKTTADNKSNVNVTYDDRGNLASAPHKDILSIEYNYIINKAIRVRKQDGRVIEYAYDSRADRILKRITNASDRIEKEIHYIRDDNGICLMERETVFAAKNSQPIVVVTVYVYGPKGLLGFYRGDNFYNVITDHQGSIRLVEMNEKIVAAYDYYPYGELMRSYEENAEASCRYRFTGHEFDDETGLYYFIARYYDPEIGRFYQIDPKGQYFSPYVYAQNSPVSLVDPNGELFWLIFFIIVLAVVGGYLGGAAANGCWDPTKWNWKSSSTWIGILTGAIAGATLPLGAVGSVAALTSAGMASYAAVTTVVSLGLGVAYAKAAASRGSWNPADWDFANPSTINDIFLGFASGTGLLGGVKGAKDLFVTLSTLGKLAFITTATAVAAASVYAAGESAKWDFKKPAIWASVFDILAAPDVVVSLHKTGKFLKFHKTLKNFIKGLKSSKMAGNVKEFLQHSIESRKFFTHVAQFSFGVGSAVFKAVGSAGSSGVDFTSILTYRNLLNDFLAGQALVTTRKDYKDFRKSFITKQTAATKTAVQNIKNAPLGLVKDATVKTSNTPVMIHHQNGNNFIKMAAFASAQVGIIPLITSRIIESMAERRKKQTEILTTAKTAVKAAIPTKSNEIDQVWNNAGKQKKDPFKYIVAEVQKIDPIRAQEVLTLHKGIYDENKKQLELWARDVVTFKENELVKIPKPVQCYKPTNKHNAQADVSFTEKNIPATMYPFDSRFDTVLSVALVAPTEEYWQSLIPTQRFLEPTDQLPIANPPTRLYPQRGSGRKRRNAFPHIDDIYNLVELDINSNGENLFSDNSSKPSWISTCLNYFNMTPPELSSLCKLNAAPHDFMSDLQNTTHTFHEEMPQPGAIFTPDYSISDTNSTLMLVDMCVRKITGENFVTNCNDSRRLLKAQEQVLNIVEELEVMMGETAAATKIDFPALQCKIFRTLAAGMGSQVRDVINADLRKALGELDLEERMNVLFYLNKYCKNKRSEAM